MTAPKAAGMTLSENVVTASMFESMTAGYARALRFVSPDGAYLAKGHNDDVVRAKANVPLCGGVHHA